MFFADSGALVVETGQRTGRSPRDKFIVHDALTSETVDWGEINQPVEPEIMDALWQRVESYMDERETLVNHLHVGSDDRHYLPVQVRTQYAWHACLLAISSYVRTASIPYRNLCGR